MLKQAAQGKPSAPLLSFSLLVDYKGRPHGFRAVAKSPASFIASGVPIMHASIYLATCIAALGSGFVFGAPDWQVLALLSAFAIAIVGVPHGGLDHLVGRRLLVKICSNRWWIIFFACYLAIAVSFAIAWTIIPIFTVLFFFIVSAWHFGREDDLANHAAKKGSTASSLFKTIAAHLQSIALGGLAIWIPAVARPEEMRWLLGLIIPANGVDNAGHVWQLTQYSAFLLIPFASVVIAYRIYKQPLDLVRWVPLATSIVCIFLPILMSFTLYFCAWHSIQGLHRLQRHESMSPIQFGIATLPLSVMAIAGIFGGGWLFGDVTAAFVAGEQSPMLQTLFIGLSAIAVPHLFLHELDLKIGNATGNQSSPDRIRVVGSPTVQEGIVS